MADTKISALTSKATPVGADTSVIVDSVGGLNKKITLGTLPISTPTQNALDLKAPIASPTFTGTASANDYAFTDVNFNTISLKEMLAMIGDAGVISGMNVTIGTPNTTFSISAGVVNFVVNTGGTYSLKTISFPAQNNIPATYIGSALLSSIGIDAAGTIHQQVLDFTTTQRRTIVPLANIVHLDMATITNVNQVPTLGISTTEQLVDLMLAVGNINLSGNKFSANGANLKLNKSVGSVFKKGCNADASLLSPHEKTTAALTALTMVYATQTNALSAPTTDVLPNLYDNAGTPTAVSTNKFTVQRIFLSEKNNVFVQYGQNQFNSMQEAIDSINEVDFVYTSEAHNLLLRAFLVVKQGTTSLLDTTKAKFITASKFGVAAAGGGGGGTASTLQQSYDVSTTPEITTNGTNGAFSLKRGSVSDGDNVLEVLNGAGTQTFSVDGTGQVNTNAIGSASSMYFLISGSTAFFISANKCLEAPFIHNNIDTLLGNGTGEIRSGTYTPTVAANGNCTALSTWPAMYSKVGNITTVTGTIDMQSANTGVFTIEIDLPNLAGVSIENIQGVFNYYESGNIGVSGIVNGGPLNGNALLTGYSSSGNGSGLISYTLQYEAG